jgi:hypothetical protein
MVTREEHLRYTTELAHCACLVEALLHTLLWGAHFMQSRGDMGSALKQGVRGVLALSRAHTERPVIPMEVAAALAADLEEIGKLLGDGTAELDAVDWTAVASVARRAFRVSRTSMAGLPLRLDEQVLPTQDEDGAPDLTSAQLFEQLDWTLLDNLPSA